MKDTLVFIQVCWSSNDVFEDSNGNRWRKVILTFSHSNSTNPLPLPKILFARDGCVKHFGHNISGNEYVKYIQTLLDNCYAIKTGILEDYHFCFSGNYYKLGVEFFDTDLYPDALFILKSRFNYFKIVNQNPGGRVYGCGLDHIFPPNLNINQASKEKILREMFPTT